MKAMKPVRILIAVLTALLALAATACASAAEIRPIPLDHDTLDLANGVFSFFVRGGDRVEKTGRFTAVLYKKDHYDGEQIRKLAPGDTVYANDRKWTVKSVQIHSAMETPDVPDSYEVFTEEDLGEEEYLAFTPCEDGTFIAVMGDWNPITLAGSVPVMLPLPDAFVYSGTEELTAADFIDALPLFTNPYTSECEFRDGLLIRVSGYDYPTGPKEPEDGSFRPVPVWKFCHGFRDGLDTAVITASMTDCEAGPSAVEISPEEAEKIRRLAMNGTVTGKASNEMVTGGTWIYTFETPRGTHLLSIELYKGLIVGSGGMYRVEGQE